MNNKKYLFSLQLVFLLIAFALSAGAQPPPDGGGGGGGGWVGSSPIGGENLLLLLGVIYGVKKYIKPFRIKK